MLYAQLDFEIASHLQAPKGLPNSIKHNFSIQCTTLKGFQTLGALLISLHQNENHARTFR
jgi:hypothetical protein